MQKPLNRYAATQYSWKPEPQRQDAEALPSFRLAAVDWRPGLPETFVRRRSLEAAGLRGLWL
jgi:hypothetical protein